jgi:hypothetical protein
MVSSRLENTSKECSNFEQISELLDKLQGDYDRMLVSSSVPDRREAGRALINSMQLLPEEERKKFLRGKKSEIRKAAMEAESRTGAYQREAANRLVCTLLEMGLITSIRGTYHDAKTNKKVISRIYEIARLKLDWNVPSVREVIEQNWEKWVALSIEELKEHIRWIKRLRKSNREQST